MSPDDFRALIEKVRASEGQPLNLQERTPVVPPWLMKEGETPEQAFARITTEAEAEDARIKAAEDNTWEGDL